MCSHYQDGQTDMPSPSESSLPARLERQQGSARTHRVDPRVMLQRLAEIALPADEQPKRRAGDAAEPPQIVYDRAMRSIWRGFHIAGWNATSFDHNVVRRYPRQHKDYEAVWHSCMTAGWCKIHALGMASRLRLEVLQGLRTIAIWQCKRAHTQPMARMSTNRWKACRDILLEETLRTDTTDEKRRPGSSLAQWAWREALVPSHHARQRVFEIQDLLVRRLQATSGSEERVKLAGSFFSAFIVAHSLEPTSPPLPSLLKTWLAATNVSLDTLVSESWLCEAFTKTDSATLAARRRALDWLCQFSFAQTYTAIGQAGWRARCILWIRRSERAKALHTWQALRSASDLSKPDGWLLTHWEDAPELDLPPSTQAEHGARTHSLDTARLTPEVVASFLAAFVQLGMVEEARSLWQFIHDRGHRPTATVWLALLDSHARRLDPDAAHDTFDRMKRSGIEPDASAWAALITAYFRASETETAMKYIDVMLANQTLLARYPNGILPRAAMNQIIGGMMHSRRTTEAMALIEQMITSGARLGIDTINILLDYHAHRKTPSLQGIDEVLQLMARHKLEPDVRTYTTLIDAMLSSGQPEAVPGLWKAMSDAKVTPNIATITTVIDHMAKSGRLEDLRAAVAMLREAEATGLQTNEITYTCLIQGFLKLALTAAPSADALRVYQSFKIGTLPSGSSADGSAFANNLGLLAAQGLVERMRRRNIALNRIGYNMFMSAYLSLGSEYGKAMALQFFDEMRARRGIHSDDAVEGATTGQLHADSWFTILNGLWTMGASDDAHRLVDMLAADGFEIRSASLHRLVKLIRA
ncbi:hypothetical protein E5Q_06248 [Mixia osmundae IAM 14324]|uniref:Pentacotripeptide-repeat region of PRORP domain-containing protein n=1 Tax=Mixia osmundae (strain CBS 9802 / IAM 14324 / JCM 22182 / KY 12970) TaxID=764103 RepID=G7E8S9_MIXOS|nr:hypothetical protein E5Q_06248 [Mixia osmundae IAM 14324]